MRFERSVPAADNTFEIVLFSYSAFLFQPENRLKEKITALRSQMEFLKGMERQVENASDQQVSLTDPDARSMTTSGKGTGIVGYNGGPSLAN